MMSEQCVNCTNFHDDKNGTFCAAFPTGKGIPEEIITGLHDHTEPFKGDRGIRFEKIEIPESELYE